MRFKRYQRIGSWFRLDGMFVMPFNGELTNHGPSWSHGLTHYVTSESKVGFCGIDYFEKHAKIMRKKEILKFIESEGARE